MKGILIAAALALLASTADAAVIGNLGTDPSSAQGNFQNEPNGLFSDQVLFTLSAPLSHLTIASVTNTFASASDFIANFTASVYNFGGDGLFQTVDDFIVIGPVAAVACQVPNCQGMAGSAILASGSYYAQLEGLAGSTAGYAGNISTAAIPIPAALPLFATGLLGIGLLRWRRRHHRMP